MSVYYNESEIPGIAQDIVDREYGGDWGEIKRDMESGDIFLADEKLVYKIQDYMGSFLDVEDEDDDVELLEDLLFYIEDRAKTSHRANRRAFRKRASERMNYGDVYTVHSDGSITTETVGDNEWVDVHVYEEEMNNDYMYDWDAIEAELYEGVVSSTGGTEPVEVVPGYFISSMSGVDVDVLADLGPGEYRLCPVSLSYWVGEGEFSDLEHDDGFDYDVVIRY